MKSLRSSLPPLPDRMRDLPVDDRGYPIPEFVSRLDGKRDFRAVSFDHMARCIRDDVCWVCGQPLGELKVFVIGPLPALQGISNEPPSHAECAEFAAKACPFLLLPEARHRSIDNPQVRKMRGAMKGNNPGVCCLYSVRGYAYSKGPKGIIFRTGEATRVEWYTHGRRATRDEVIEAIRDSFVAVGRESGEEAFGERIAKLLPR
jgi:hypothetical protein